jgi:phage host-nuclease inhibitor protein Gam
MSTEKRIHPFFAGPHPTLDERNLLRIGLEFLIWGANRLEKEEEAKEASERERYRQRIAYLKRQMAALEHRIAAHRHEHVDNAFDGTN